MRILIIIFIIFSLAFAPGNLLAEEGDDSPPAAIDQQQAQEENPPEEKKRDIPPPPKAEDSTALERLKGALERKFAPPPQGRR